jgi:hypothetical protein
MNGSSAQRSEISPGYRIEFIEIKERTLLINKRWIEFEEFE